MGEQSCFKVIKSEKQILGEEMLLNQVIESREVACKMEPLKRKMTYSIIVELKLE